jgi:beta-lactamase regulating signal transducer with metallopeptidase domain
MSDLVALRALLLAGEMFAGSALLLGSASIACRHIRQASVRHFVWTTAFGALLVLPILTAIAHPAIRVSLPTPVQEISAAPLLTSQAMATPAPQVSAASLPHLDLQTIALGFGALWLAGAGAVLLHGLLGALRLRALRRQSSAYALAPRDLPNVSARRQECELRLSLAQHGPMTWGIFRPVILLPKNSLFWPRERRHAVLLHELAHVRRRDSLTHVLSLFVSALYWPNPLVWIGGRAMRREAEIASDDAVIASGVRPSTYAKELLELASEFRVQLAFSGTPFSMAAPSALESRLKSVLARNPVRSGVTKMDVLKILGATLLATTALALARPSVAEEAPQPPDVTGEAPLVPDIPPAPPPVPPAPPVSAAVPQPPAPPVPEAHAKPGLDVHIYRKLTPEERAHIRAIARKAQREAEAAIARAQPDIDQAMAKVQPEIDRALAKAQPEIDRALAQVAKSQPDMGRVMHKIDRARPQIQQAMALARTELARAHLDAKIRARVDAALQRAQARLEAREHRREMRDEAREGFEESHETDEPDTDSDMPDAPDAH